MKLVAIDYGRRRIGCAATDSEGRMVRGLPTIDRQRHPDFISKLCAVIAEQNPGQLVVGLPLDIDDADTVMSREVRSFAAKLSLRTGLPVAFIDESYSSQKAASLMFHRKKKERQDKGAVDRMAACLILEAFIREHECSGEKDLSSLPQH